MDHLLSMENVRQLLCSQYSRGKFITDKTGVKTVEIIAVNFLANESTLFGKPSFDYIEREKQWYDSMSLFVKDIPGGLPKIWQEVSDYDGKINSNYGWAIYHRDNFNQFENTVKELVKNPDSRRAIMIYNRPSMWLDFNRNGMSDFICTTSVQYFIRDNKLHSLTTIRSNDSIFGFSNDRAWQEIVLRRLYEILRDNYPLLEVGDLLWSAGSLHVYERHFYLLDHYLKTGEWDVERNKIKS